MECKNQASLIQGPTLQPHRTNIHFYDRPLMPQCQTAQHIPRVLVESFRPLVARAAPVAQGEPPPYWGWCSDKKQTERDSLSLFPAQTITITGLVFWPSFIMPLWLPDHEWKCEADHAGLQRLAPFLSALLLAVTLSLMPELMFSLLSQCVHIHFWNLAFRT